MDTEPNDTEPNTMAEDVTPQSFDEAERHFNRLARKAAQRAAWAGFGTIGFDAYKAWVLQQAGAPCR